MISTKAIWICPKLCGCELEIDADWVKEPLQEGGRSVSYQHPIPFTIRGIEIINVCIDHQSFRTDPLPLDPYNGCTGYIQLPIINPTEAQKVYIQLYKYNGQRLRPDTCGCSIYQCFDDFTKERFIRPHGAHTRKCSHHALDDDAHTGAFENMSRKNRIMNRLTTLFPALTDNDIFWRFDNTRLLHITIAGITTAQRTAAQTWCDTNLGIGRVIIEP